MINSAKTKSALVRPSMGGNQNARRHGLYATQKNDLLRRDRRVRYRVDKYRKACSWLNRPEFWGVLREYCGLEVRLTDIDSVLARVGIYSNKLKDDDLVPRRLLHEQAKLASLYLAYARELGLTPASAATMRVSVLEGDQLALEKWKAGNAAD